jgi:hypothetical protein
MSCNIFINSSIYNYSVNDIERIKKVLDAVDKPNYTIDEDGNITIEEDFDRRHISAILEMFKVKK